MLVSAEEHTSCPQIVYTVYMYKLVWFVTKGRVGGWVGTTLAPRLLLASFPQ